MPSGRRALLHENQFRRYYHLHARVHKATIRLEHKSALSLEVDWAGTRIAFFDGEAGKMSKASLFVAVLPCSRIIYVEPFRDEKLPSWIAGHVNAFQYLGGVPKTIVPDNLKSGVNRPDFYEPDLNKSYQEMAAYLGTVILPARFRKSRDKASAENAVLISSRKIIAALRNVQILTLHNRLGLMLDREFDKQQDGGCSASSAREKFITRPLASNTSDTTPTGSTTAISFWNSRRATTFRTHTTSFSGDRQAAESRSCLRLSGRLQTLSENTIHTVAVVEYKQ